MANYKTIRQTNKETGIPEAFIRSLVANEECPGFYTGNRFMVNVDQLMEKLEEESKSHTKFPFIEKRR